MTKITPESIQRAFSDGNLHPLYASDCTYIVKLIYSRYNVWITLYQAYSFWRIMSEEYYCAGWCSLPDDEILIKRFEEFVTKNS